MRLSELQSNEEKDKGEKTSDPRLKSEQFRRDVRLVFADLEIENNGKNFRKYDSIIDWVEYAANLKATGSPLEPPTPPPVDEREQIGRMVGANMKVAQNRTWGQT